MGPIASLGFSPFIFFPLVFWTPKGNSGPRWAAVSNEIGPKRLICFGRLNWVGSFSHGRSGAAVTRAESGGGDDGGDRGGVPLQGLRMGGAPGRGGERRLFTLPSRAFRCFLFLFLPFLWSSSRRRGRLAELSSPPFRRKVLQGSCRHLRFRSFFSSFLSLLSYIGSQLCPFDYRFWPSY